MKLDKIQNTANDRIEKSSHFLAGLGSIDMTDKEKATTLIEMHTNMLAGGHSAASFEYAVGHVEGLILGCDMSRLITKKEAKNFQEKVLATRREFDK